MKKIAFKVQEDLLELLDRYAIRHGLNRSEVIRKAIETMVKKELEREDKIIARVEKGIRLTRRQ